ncbi:MAG: redoxin domain-containing protein [Bacteroidota bacterium]
MRSYITLFTAFLFFTACQNQVQEKEEETTPSETTAIPLAQTAPEVEVTYLNTAVGSVPIYNNFEGVAPYFERNNDTTYVINFWATWCKPCVEELPYFEELQAEYQAQKVQVVLVSMDFKRQLESKLKPFLEEWDLQSQVVVLTDNKYNNWIDQVDTDWDGAIPVTLIYNANKKMFYSHNFLDKQELVTAVNTFL